ncbi:MAG: hypothetical protein ACR2H9_14800, partial [Longimicrobiaceae bacterium]
MSTIMRTAPALGPAPAAPVQRLLRTVRSAWVRAVLLRGLAIGAALLVAGSLALMLLDLLLPLAAAAREPLRFLPLAAAAGVLLVAAIRTARPPPASRLALLAEERLPGLENRLLTALELRGEGPVARAFWMEAETRLAGADVHRVVPLRVRVPLLALGLALAMGTAGVLLFPGASAEAWNRWLHPEDSY